MTNEEKIDALMQHFRMRAGEAVTKALIEPYSELITALDSDNLNSEELTPEIYTSIAVALLSTQMSYYRRDIPRHIPDAFVTSMCMKHYNDAALALLESLLMGETTIRH